MAARVRHIPVTGAVAESIEISGHRTGQMAACT